MNNEQAHTYTQVLHVVKEQHDARKEVIEGVGGKRPCASSEVLQNKKSKRERNL